MQILIVDKESQRAIVGSTEKAKRCARTRPDAFAFFELRFGKTARPVLKPLEIRVVEKKRPTFVVVDSDGKEVTE